MKIQKTSMSPSAAASHERRKNAHTSVGTLKIHTQTTVALPVIIEKMTSEATMTKEITVPMWVVAFE